MGLKWDLPEYLSKVGPLVVKAEDTLTKRKSWVAFEVAGRSLFTSAMSYFGLFHPMANSLHWGMAVNTLLGEIVFAIANTQANVRLYRKRIKKGSRPTHIHGPASFYSGDAILRVDACRDKLALMLLALEEPLDPEDARLPGFADTMKRLRGRESKSLTAKKAVKLLRRLEGGNFDFVKKYRRLASHRANPRVEIYGAAPHHDYPHVVLVRKADEPAFLKKLAKDYPDPTQRQKVLDGCRIGGVLYRHKKADRVVSYSELERGLLRCLWKLMGCFCNAVSLCGKSLEKQHKSSITPSP